jgi:phosphoesterase RecJ-like protein
VTDTGRFQYEATTPETLRVAAELRRHPFDHAALGQAFFEDGSLSYLRLLSTALDRVTHVPDVDLVWTYVTQADLVRAGIELGDLDDLIDVIRTAREADVACVVKQQRDGRFRVSLRSRRATDVGSIAAAFGGGGHRLAAGYTARGGLEEAAGQLVDALRVQRSSPTGPDA